MASNSNCPDLSFMCFCPEKKPKVDVCLSKCVICQHTTSEHLREAHQVGRSTILRAARARKDEVLLNLENTMSNDNALTLRYHSQCYKTYTSERNIAFQTDDDDMLDNKEKENISGVATRSKCQILHDGCKCLFCNTRTRTPVHKITSSSCQTSILNAAFVRQDFKMISLVESTDLVASKAVYHGPCLASYVSKANLASLKAPHDTTNDFDVAFIMLIKHIDRDLKQGHAFRMKTLHEMFCSYAPNTNEAFESYQVHKLQSKLQTFYGDKIVVCTQHGQGQSNIIIGSHVSLADAIKACAKLKEVFHAEQFEFQTAASEKTRCNEYSVLHAAAGILRDKISQIPVATEYYSVGDIDMETTEKYVPDEVKQFILWLVSHDAFEKADLNPVAFEKMSRTVLDLAQCLIYACNKNAVPPLQHGLAVQLYHNYGKRELIDILHCHGFTISYQDLLAFLTTVAEAEINRMTENVYVPYGLTKRQDGGKLIHEGDDNVDINCQTIDGKGTFHSMARVVFQEQPLQSNRLTANRLKVGNKKTLMIADVNAQAMKTVAYFDKPKERPEPVRTVDALNTIHSLTNDFTNIHPLDLTWVVLRMMQRGELLFYPDNEHINPDCIPFWAGFNAKISSRRDTITVATYAPILDAKPSDPSTVYSTMLKCKEMTNELGQDTPIQTMDQQLYAVAQQVKWAKPLEFPSHVLRLGGFHTACCFISTIGQIWADGGLADLLVESGVYAANTAEQMLLGKQFHRAVRGLTLCYEVLTQLLLSEYFKQCDDDFTGELREKIRPLSTQLFEIDANHNADDLKILVKEINTILTQSMSQSLRQFCDRGSKMSATFRYWCMFLHAVQILLSNVRAEREGDWSLHLATQKAMLPYFFATDHYNYARWLPVYLLDMTSLPEDVSQAFLNGEFAVRRTTGQFNAIWSDMGTETTVIRDAKSESGIVGLTRKEAALVRWTLTRNILGEYSRAMKQYSGVLSFEEAAHSQTKPAAVARDESHARSLAKHLLENMTNPFKQDETEKLINISSGVYAPEEVKDDLLSVLEVGEEKMSSFIESTLSSEGNKSFYAPLSRTNLKTFTTLKKKTSVVIEGKRKNITMEAELVFRRALALTNVRNDISLEQVMQYPVTAVPTSLFHEDGTMRKTSKAELIHCLEAILPVQPTTDDRHSFSTKDYVYIRDAMAELHQLHYNCKTFGDLAYKYMKQVLKCFEKADVIVDVYDQYENENSVKGEERYRRQTSVSGAREYQVISGRLLPPWDKFMSVSANKKSLSDFLCSYFCEHAAACVEIHENTDRKVYLAGGYRDGDITVCVSKDGVANVGSLYSIQEEADTRMLFHAFHADKEFAARNQNGKVIIKSADTDVFVLALHYFPLLESTHYMWMEMGKRTSTSDKRRLVPIHEIALLLDDNVLEALPAIHALTGCDTVSAIYGFGKKKVWKTVEHLLEHNCLPELQVLSKQNVDRSLLEASKFVAALYAPSLNYEREDISMTSLRVKFSKNGSSLNKIPASEPSFKEHVKRASFQCQIWFAANEAKPELPSPELFGWLRDDMRWRSKYFEGPTSAEMLDELVCTCHGSLKCSRHCTCALNGFECSTQCSCQGAEECHNDLQTILEDFE